MKKLIIRPTKEEDGFKWVIKEKVNDEIKVIRKGIFDPSSKKQIDGNGKEYTIVDLKQAVDKIVDKNGILDVVKDPATEYHEWVIKSSEVINFKSLCRIVDIPYERFTNYKRGTGKITLQEMKQLKETVLDIIK